MEFDRAVTCPPSLENVTITLTADESADAARECTQRASELLHAPLDSQELLTEAELAGCRLPDRLLRVLSRFRVHGNELGGLVVRNVPVDAALPATPGGTRPPDWQAIPVATFAQLAVASRLGDVISYADEKNGALVQDVVPVKGAEARQENSGTVYLELHTEDGFHPYRPDFVTLLCVRPDPARVARTLLGAATRVLSLLPEACEATLREPLFRIRTSSSFGDSGTGVLSPPLPVLSGYAHDVGFVADFHAMEPVNGRASAALAELEAVLVPSLAGIVLGMGDLLVIDNRAAVHGRTAFTARYDGTDRWLRRCFTVADLRPSRASRPRGSRVCAPLAVIGFPAQRYQDAPLWPGIPAVVGTEA